MSLREFAGRFWLPLALTLLLSTTAAFAQETPPPRVDIFGGYSWINPGARVGPLKLDGITKGFGIETTINFNRYFGIAIDSDNHYSNLVNMSTFTVGPRLKWRPEDEHIHPFIQGMIGLHRVGIAGLGTDNRVGGVLGGGIDVAINRRFSWRLIEADYVVAHHNYAPTITGTEEFNGVRLRGGLVVNLGLGAPPLPLAASCAINPAEVMTGEPVSMTVTPSNIQKNHTVEYAYMASNGAKVSGTGTTANVDTNGLAPGSYTVTATVTDPKAKKMPPATCNASFTIKEPPKQPPTISCSANPTTVQAGTPATITATGNSPDNRPLTYTFTASGGRISPSGATATLDTAGASAGPITVTCSTSDDRGLTASGNTTVNVEVPPPPPQASKLNEIQFKNKRRPARVDNEAKAILDDVALRLQRDADAKAVIVGHFDPSEKNGQKVAQERAVNTKAYLTKEKGIDPGRIEVRTGTGGMMKADIYIVPSGATFNEPGAETFDESMVKAGRDQYAGQHAAPMRHRRAKKPAMAPQQ